MVSGTLYTYPDSFRGIKSQVAAKFSNAKVKVVNLKGDETKYVKVPTFESDDKKVTLFESNAIAYYVASEQLRGGSELERAQVLQWIEYGNNEIIPASSAWVFPALSLLDFHKEHVEKAKSEVKRILTLLNDHLKTRTYLVGERVSLADITVACDLALLYQHVLDAKFREPFVNTNRWFTTIVNQPHFTAVAGEFKLCTTAAEYCATKHQENKTRGGAAAEGGKKEKKEKKEKEQKPKEEKKKPEPKAAAAPEPADDLDEADEIMNAEPKANDPFAAMPKGNFNMDEFKRTYSNMELTESLPYLWKNFDRENYTMWYCEYKYPEELKLTFMTSNLIGGMFQRLDKLRKNAFGSMCVWGENNNNTIAGVWFWKGHELAFPLSPDWTTDYESYNWRKMNVDDEADRKLAEQVFSWEGEINGKKYVDGKIFK